MTASQGEAGDEEVKPVELNIADERWSVDQAAAVCRWYTDNHPATLTYPDFGGTDATPHAHDRVDLADA